jgi:hypothetical protein
MSGNKTISLQISVGDLPMMAHAFMIARNTALMCGHSVAKKRLAAYLAQIEALIPPEIRIFDPEVWAEICAAISTCNDWSCGIREPRWDRNHHEPGCIVIRVDDKTWVQRPKYFKPEWSVSKPEWPEFPVIENFLMEVSGIESKRIEYSEAE